MHFLCHVYVLIFEKTNNIFYKKFSKRFIINKTYFDRFCFPFYIFLHLITIGLLFFKSMKTIYFVTKLHELNTVS